MGKHIVERRSNDRRQADRRQIKRRTIERRELLRKEKQERFAKIRKNTASFLKI